MNKPFPEIQLLSDLIQSTPSSVTLTPENDLDDGHISLKADLTPDIQHENYSDDVASLSQDDQPSSIIVVSEFSEKQQPVLSTKHASVSVPTVSIAEHQSGLQPLLEDANILNFHEEPAAVGQEPVRVLKKSATTTWTTCSSVTTVQKYTTDAIREPYERKDLHVRPQKLHSMFDGDQFRNSVRLSASVLDYEVKEPNLANSTGTKKLPVKQEVNVNHLPKVQNSSVGIWGWLCPRNLLHSIVDKAWASIDAVITTLDPQMKSSSSGVKPDFEILVATTSDIESLPIRKAFRKIFLGKVVTHHLSVTLGCIPPQPVGFQSGLFCAESRIKFMREHKLVEKNKIIVATSPVLVEATPLRWHYTNCIMLDDPRIGLTLHTFTQTVPVPNVYANQAQLRTPADYHLRHLGFNITVGRVISIMTGIPENDWQYTMTGTSFNKILESATAVLAGLYKSYLSGV